MVCTKCGNHIPSNSRECEYCKIIKKKSILNIFLVIDLFLILFNIICCCYLLPCLSLSSDICYTRVDTLTIPTLILFSVTVALSLFVLFEYSHVNQRLFKLKYQIR